MDAKPPLGPTLRALADKARRGLDDHPTPEELVAYRAGELTPPDDERIQDHLALCPDCSQLLLDLKEFENGKPEEAGLSDAQVEAAWRRLRPRLEERKILTSRRWFAAPQFAYGLAAALLVCTVGLSVWVVALRRTIEEINQPQVNVAYADLYAPDEVRRSAGPQDAENVVPPGGLSFVLMVHAWNAPAFSEYEAVFRRTGDGGKPVLVKPGLTRNEEGILSMELSRQHFSPGSYQLELYGGSGPQRSLVDTYDFEVAPPT